MLQIRRLSCPSYIGGDEDLSTMLAHEDVPATATDLLGVNERAQLFLSHPTAMLVFHFPADIVED